MLVATWSLSFCLFASANLLLNLREGIHKWPLFWLEFRPCFGGLTFKNRVKSRQKLPDSWFWLVKLGKNCFDWLLTSTPPPPKKKTAKNHRESPYVGHASQLGSKSLTLWSLGLPLDFGIGETSVVTSVVYTCLVPKNGGFLMSECRGFLVWDPIVQLQFNDSCDSYTCSNWWFISACSWASKNPRNLQGEKTKWSVGGLGPGSLGIFCGTLKSQPSRIHWKRDCKKLSKTHPKPQTTTGPGLAKPLVN